MARNNPRLCQNINLSVSSKERVAIVGEEASGKSRLMRVMAGLLEPESGQVLWQGHDLSSQLQNQSMNKIGLLFRDPDARFLCATPHEESALTLTFLGLHHETLSLRIAESLTMAGLDPHHAHCTLSTLSASQRYRAAVAAVLAARPQLLLMDEPGALLSDTGETDFAQRLLVFGQTHGTTMVVFTSRPARASLFADRIVRLA